MPRPAEAGPSRPVATGVLRRALGNAGLLLSGKGAAGLMQLATFALAARALGLREFGLFSVMLAQIQLLIGLATFQSSQAIVRYGVIHHNADDREAFQRLVKFGTLLDLSAAAAASLVALVTVPIVAAAAGWEQQFIAPAEILALLPLAYAISTPKGMLRLFGRFDLLAQQVTLTPLARLLGTAAVAIAGGGLFALAGIWLIASFVGAAAAVFLAWREAGRNALLAGLNVSLRKLTAGNPGIWRFSLMSNLHTSLIMLPQHVATIASGIILGAPAAALVKVAQEIGTALAKPIDLVNQAVYPDIARLSESAAWRRLHKVIVRSGTTAAMVAGATTLLLVFVGEPVIGLVFGDEFEGAFLLLLLISASMTLTLAVFAAVPTLYALGRPSGPLLIGLGTDLTFVVALFAAFPVAGTLAPGVAYIASAFATVALSLWLLKRALSEAKAQ